MEGRLGDVREPLASFHSDGKAFKEDRKEQEHCIQSKIANQPYSHSYDIRISVENNRPYLQEFDLNFDLLTLEVTLNHKHITMK